VARGLTTVGASPTLLVSGFVTVLLMWLASIALSVGSVSQVMAWYLALPPVNSILADVRFVEAAGFGGGLTGALAGVVLVAFRAATMALWVGAILVLLRGGSERQAIRGAARALTSRFLSVLAIMAAFFALALVGLSAQSSGSSIGPLLLIGGMLLGLYFLVYTPIVAVCEAVSIRDAARFSVRAARIPGPAHALLVSFYLVFTVFFPLALPSGRLPMATPTIATWIFVLFMAFIQLGALAVFVFRWLIVREAVLESAGVDPAESQIRYGPEPADGEVIAGSRVEPS
jgi:hypothetical protein